MTQEELYWFEKRLNMRADTKEREIRDKYNYRIRGLLEVGKKIGKTENQIRRDSDRLEHECRNEIEFARLTILEPVLDAKQKVRLQSIKWQKQQEELKAQREAEEARKRNEREKNERERREKEKREEERRLAKEAAERAKREEQERIIREEKARREREEQEKREKTKRVLGLFFGVIAAVGVIAAIIIFRKYILAAIIVVIVISALVSS